MHYRERTGSPPLCYLLGIHHLMIKKYQSMVEDGGVNDVNVWWVFDIDSLSEAKGRGFDSRRGANFFNTCLPNT